MTENIKITQARQEQSASDKKSVLDKLRNKKRRSKTLTIMVDGEPVILRFEAISATELDKLRAKHPPTKEQRANNMGVNSLTFAPALVSACLVDPKMTEDEARELWTSDYWSTGELADIFEAASSVSMEGMDIPFTSAD